MANDSGQDHSALEFASNDWSVNLRKQVRLLRSHLASKSSDHNLEDNLRALLSDYLVQYTSPLGNMNSTEGLYMLRDQNHTCLEAAFMWLGAWRPTSVITLVHSVLGLEAQKLAQQTMNLSETQPKAVPLLSERQLYSLNSLQIHTRQAEHDLSNKLALLQMLIADQPMITALNSENWSKRIELFKVKVSELRELLTQAEKLRKETLQELFSILSPVQAAKCSIAAFELIFAFKSLSGFSFGNNSLSRQAVTADCLSTEADGSTVSVPSTTLMIGATKWNAEDKNSSKQSGPFLFESRPTSGVNLASDPLSTELPEKIETDTSDFLYMNELERVCGSASAED